MGENWGSLGTPDCLELTGHAAADNSKENDDLRDFMPCSWQL